MRKIFVIPLYLPRRGRGTVQAVDEGKRRTHSVRSQLNYEYKKHFYSKIYSTLLINFSICGIFIYWKEIDPNLLKLNLRKAGFII